MKTIIKPPAIDKSAKFRIPSTMDASGEELHPFFCLQYVENKYCITRCNKIDKASFADKLRKLSQLTWQQIHNADRHGLGCENISRDEIRKQIPKHITMDVTSFLAIRYSKLKPMVGYRKGNVFHIVWFDDDFTVYNHGKK